MHVLSNGPWWNNPRDAVGMYRWAQRTSDEKLREYARRIVNLAMLAPRTDGLFACEYHVDRKEWKPGLFFVTEKAAADAIFGTVDATNARPRSYQTAGCSVTGIHLLRYYRLCEKGEQVIDYVSLYQTVWDPHFVYTAYAYGGFDTDNGDAA